MPESDARLAEIVRRHLDVDAVADVDADEIFAHLAGNMGEDFVAVGQGHSKHCARQHLGHRAGQFNWFFFWHVTVKRGEIFANVSIENQVFSG